MYEFQIICARRKFPKVILIFNIMVLIDLALEPRALDFNQPVIRKKTFCFRQWGRTCLCPLLVNKPKWTYLKCSFL